MKTGEKFSPETAFLKEMDPVTTGDSWNDDKPK